MNAQQVRAMINSVYTAALTQVVLDGNVGPEVGYQLKTQYQALLKDYEQFEQVDPDAFRDLTWNQDLLLHPPSYEKIFSLNERLAHLKLTAELASLYV